MTMRQKKRSNTKIYIVIGFLLLYAAGMFLSTFLMKEQSHQLGITAAGEVNQIIVNNIEDVEKIYNEDGTLSDYSRDYMQYILSDKTHYLNKYTQYSAGLLDANGNLIAETSDSFFNQGPHYLNDEPIFDLIDDMGVYFTEEEIKTFREYFTVESQKSYPELDSGYCAKVAYDRNNGKLVHFYIYESEERKHEDGTIENVFMEEAVFAWQNPDYEGKNVYFPSFKLEERHPNFGGIS